MAKNPEWRGDVGTWKERVNAWVDRSDPHDLLNIDIFFDLRGVHGDVSMADRQWRYAFEVAKGRPAFAKLLAELTQPGPSPVGWFGRLKTERGRIDLKKTGLFGIVGAARALAICHHLVERSTAARLDRLRAIAKSDDVDALEQAHALFVDFILDQQLEDIQNGIRPSNSVAVARLSWRDRRRLKDALESIAHLDQMVRDLLFVS